MVQKFSNHFAEAADNIVLKKIDYKMIRMIARLSHT